MSSAPVAVASLAAAAATLAALVGVVLIVRDIDNMRFEIEGSMKEAKVGFC
ncbi:unnamed protein product [Strongylus vulgaris]|uniref:Nematode cuticle collagen N-terminal domain-containing protein n=1 Tax=Strongylus vulgaris TaxID=40348 RepID=A0A3P7IR00_STRVU|nr:unnamed protein product [Strongylus vulgaris]